MQILIVALVVVLGAGAMWLLSAGESETAANRNNDSDVPAMEAEMNDTDSTIVEADNEPDIETESVVTENEDAQPEPTNESLYANGTYTKTGNYVSPAGQEEVSISLTITDDVVTDADFVGEATNPASVNNQNKFAAGFETAVVGKSLDEISLTVVNGSSLTPKGFMDALVKIKAEAAQS